MNTDTLIICSNENTAAFARLTFGCDAVCVDPAADLGRTKWERIVVAATYIVAGDRGIEWIAKLAHSNLRPGGELVWL